MLKSLARVQIKDADQGLVTAVISTFGVIDNDGDVTSKSTFTEGAPVVVSAYGHKSWDGGLPLGKGTIRTTDSECIADLKFFLNTPHGRAAFDTIKELGDLQEWSYSLHNTLSHKAQLNGRTANFIDSTTVKECSPVLMGASIDTRTVAAKAVKQLAGTVARMLSEAASVRWCSIGEVYCYCYLDDFDLDAGTAVFCVVDYTSRPSSRRYVQVDFVRTDTSVTLGATEIDVEYTTVYLPKGAKFSEHFDFALRGVKQLEEMTRERLPLRVAEGKSIAEQTDAHAALAAALDGLKSAIDDATQPTPDERAALEAEYLRFVSTTSQGG